LRPDLVAAGRKQLVGLLADDPKFVLDEGAQIVDTPDQPIPMKMIGHVTSSYDSPAAGRSIAMAVIQNGRARMGETVHVTTPKGFTKAVIAKPVFYDETGEKVKSTGDFTAPARIEKIAERRTCLARKPVIGVAGGPIHVVQVAPMARFVLKGTIGYGTGLSFQQEINHAEADGALHSLRLGPAEWLALAPDSERETLVAAIKGRASSVVDISHRNVALSITGAKVCEVLNSGVPLDLDLAAFPIGMATRTLLGKAEILLWRKGEQAFHIECWRSFSFYVHAYLAEAAREFL
jgi:heterotetrameric sarcosine oxidase gamma subunit